MAIRPTSLVRNCEVVNAGAVRPGGSRYHAVYIPRMMRYGGSTTRGTEMAKWRQGNDGKWVKEKREKKPKPAKGRQAGSVSGILGRGKK
jgi:hypothetical protein